MPEAPPVMRTDAPSSFMDCLLSPPAVIARPGLVSAGSDAMQPSGDRALDVV
jgi:hypothetical protein